VTSLARISTVPSTETSEITVPGVVTRRSPS